MYTTDFGAFFFIAFVWIVFILIKSGERTSDFKEPFDEEEYEENKRKANRERYNY